MRLTFLFTLLYIPVVQFAQPLTFERTYDAGRETVIFDMLLLSDRVVLAGSQATDGGGRWRGVVYNLNYQGNKINANLWPAPNRHEISAITATQANDDYVAAGEQLIGLENELPLRSPVFHHLSKDGRQLNAFGEGRAFDDEDILGLTTGSNQNILATGTGRESNAAIVKCFTPRGDNLWHKTFHVPGAGNTVFEQAIPLSDGYLVSGYYKRGPNDYPVLLVKYDNAGTLIWTKTYAWPGRKVGDYCHLLQLPGGGFLLVANTRDENLSSDIALLEVNSSGDLLRSTRIGVPDVTDFAIDVELDPATPGGFFLVGEYRPTGRTNSSATLLRMSNIRDPNLRVALFAPEQGSYFSSAAVDSEGFYWLAGNIRACDDAYQSSYLVKTDANLNTPPRACLSESITYNRSSLTVAVATDLGVSTDRESISFPLVNNEDIPYNTRNRGCAIYDLDGDNSSGESLLNYRIDRACYVGPLSITDTDVKAVNQGGYTDSLIISLFSDPAIEYLQLNGQRSDDQGNLVIRNDGTLTDEYFVEQLRQITYHNEETTITNEERFITVTAYAGCDDPATALVTIDLIAPRALAPILTDTTICTGSSFTLDVSTIGVRQYDWGDGAQGAVRDFGAAGVYTLLRTSSCGVTADTFEITNTSEAPFPQMPPLDFVCATDSILIDLSADGVTVAWDDGNTTPTRYFSQPGNRSVVLNNGCRDTSIMFSLLGEDCCPVYLPTAFSPNGDGINDRFKPYYPTACRDIIVISDFRIYDRWGGLVYQGTSLTEGWDGQSAGRYLPEGTYVYQLNYFDGAAPRLKQGNIMVVR